MTPSEILCKTFSFSKSELYQYVLTCPYRYKKYRIPKRNRRGTRLIAHPSRDLKTVQRLLLDEFLVPKLKIHKCATAYKKSSSILRNAEPHLKNSYLLKMDFKDFFPSIQMSDFDQFLLDKSILQDEDERRILGRVFFMREKDKLVLSIGSPGSPVISNSLLYEFDDQANDLCRGLGISYTRYSDDMTFSTNVKDVLFKLPEKISEILGVLAYPKLRINSDKTVFSSKKFNRHVTGITITNDGKASIGRVKKREIRTRVFLSDNGKHSEKDLLSLRGYISFAQSVDSDFVDGLWKKYPEKMKKLFSL